MLTNRRSLLVYGLLLAAWCLVLGWQVTEYFRVQREAQTEVSRRARDISTTLGIVLRSQRRFGGVISKERLESALTDLVRPGELEGIALLNATGEVVASAGTLIEVHPKNISGPSEQWDNKTVTMVNRVDLGATFSRDQERTNPPVILPQDDFYRTLAPAPGFFSSNRTLSLATEPSHGETPAEAERTLSPTNPPTWGRTRGGEGWPRFGRPLGMNETQYREALQKQGAHSLLVVMSTRPVIEACRHDLRLRAIIVLLAAVSGLGLGVAWRNLGKSAELQIRLVRSSELNSNLRGLSLAAAGLAHETRNPLNIVRGLAQMISQQPNTPDEVRSRSRQITEEVDRVSAQLNEFINYSRPREVRWSTVVLGSVAADVVRTLQTDIEDKHAEVKVNTDNLAVKADEALLRQVLFNLLLNSIQAVDPNGTIEIAARKTGTTEVQLEIRDNGPGVAPEHRNDIFKPYFTTHRTGTGLGLAIVHQIVLTHGWEIEYIPNEGRGAVFRLGRLALS